MQQILGGESEYLTRRVAVVFLPYLASEGTMYKEFPIPESPATIEPKTLTMKIYRIMALCSMDWFLPLYNLQQQAGHYYIGFYQNGAKSCQVPKQVRIVLVPFQIISSDQIFNPFLDCLEIRLQIHSQYTVNLGVLADKAGV